LDQKIGDYMIGCIDNKGYLTATAAEIGAILKVDTDDVLRVLKLVQSFQPYGVGARDLVECLLIQLEQYGRLDELHAEIVQKYLIELGAGKLNKIAASLGVSVQKVQGACDFIRSLDPKPGLQYGYEDIRYIAPDVIVEKVESDYVVTVNQAGLPKIVFNSLCAEMMTNPQHFTSQELKYIQDKMNAGIWLFKCLDQRRNTLNRVATRMVEWQRGFFDYGVRRIQPLTMKQLADELEIHESTVSRAIAHKYIQTPRGLFEMKYFFSNSLDAQEGAAKLSSTCIKSILEEIIAAEDPFHPLSDQLIVKHLDAKGVKLSRRTVAKYRQEMHIPATTGRKRYRN
jgi:RNA polymerase sigma-54 factor